MKTKFIKLKTKIPGPKSQRALDKRKKWVAKAMAIETPMTVAHAENALMTDLDGNVIIDFAGGIGVLNVGQCNPAIVKAVKAQAEKFLHTCTFVATYEGYANVAERLCRIAPMGGVKKASLFNTGAEANENAIKVAKAFTKKPNVIAFEHAFHGRTWMALTLTYKEKPYKTGLAPFVEGVFRAPLPYLYRRPSHLSEKEFVQEHIEMIHRFFESSKAHETVAAAIIEPVIGEGGYLVPPKEWFKELRKACDENNVLLIADEVQSGFCRTGKMWAVENFNVKPDLVSCAKSIAGGLPLSGIVGKEEIVDSLQLHGMGGTYSGNPLSCAAAEAAIDFMLKKKLWKSAENIGNITRRHFSEIQRDCDKVGDVRGIGAMNALEFVEDLETKEPGANFRNRVLRKCWSKGLLVLGAGTFENVIRTLMPLTIPEAQLREGLEVLKEAVEEAR